MLSYASVTSKSILVPDERICVISSLKSPYIKVSLVRRMLEKLPIDQIQSVVCLGDMVETERGFEGLTQIFESLSQAVDCIYWVPGSLENYLGQLDSLASKMGLEALIEQRKLILSGPSLEAFDGKWLLAYERDRRDVLSSAELLARVYQKNVMVSSPRWAVSEVEGGNLIIDSGSLSNKPGYSNMYWYLLDGVPYPQVGGKR